KTFVKEGYAAGRRAIKPIMKRFCKLAGSLPLHTKCIGINAKYTDFGTIFSKYLSVRCTSHLPGISYGCTHRIRRQSLKFSIHYFVGRYLYAYTDQIRSILLKWEGRVRKWFASV